MENTNNRRSFLALMAIVAPSLLLSKSVPIGELVAIAKKHKLSKKGFNQIHNPTAAKKDLKFIKTRATHHSRRFNGLTPSKGSVSLNIVNLHTDEESKILFKKDGKYLKEGLEAFNYIARDFRNDKVAKMDYHLLDILYATKKKTHSKSSIFMLSGYRSPETNKRLKGAKHSFHKSGKAFDFSLSNRKPDTVAAAVRKMKTGGVGKYNHSQFVHIDTGRVRCWNG